MIIYDSTVPHFIELCKTPKILAIEISKNLLEKFGINVAENEVNSWMASLPRVSSLLNTKEGDNRRVLVEFNVPTTKQRVDFIILGKDSTGKPSAWILELKQWSHVTEVAWNEFRVGKYIDSHPSKQANDYKERLEHELGLFDKVNIKSSAYLHNLTSVDTPLMSKVYYEDMELSQLYGKFSEYILSDVINEHTIIQDGDRAFESFKSAKWSPSKHFKQIVEEEFKSLKLVGSQKEIYEKIEHFIKTKNKDDKITFIISGDPGSGKTIVAFKLLMLLVKELGMKIQLMLPGQEVRDAIKHQLRNSKLSRWITGSTVHKGNEAAIIDEAHKAVGWDYGWKNYEVFYETLKFAIIFIDNDQVINKKGISKEKVSEIAKKAGHSVHYYEIEENFRNGGERTILDWIDNIFYDRSTKNRDFEYRQSKYINKNNNYKLKSYLEDDEFMKSYMEYYSSEGSTRMTSLWHNGFYLGDADKDSEIPKTVSIGKHLMVWNPNDEWFKKLTKQQQSTYSKSVRAFVNHRRSFLMGTPKPEYIAYFNHIQGYEFDNIFVYIPTVFTYENGEIIFHRDRLAKEVQSQTWSPTSKSPNLSGKDPTKLNKSFFLNRIKVMLTRGTKSTHVYAEDEALNNLIYNSVEPD